MKNIGIGLGLEGIYKKKKEEQVDTTVQKKRSIQKVYLAWRATAIYFPRLNVSHSV